MTILKKLPIEKIQKENRKTVSIRITDNATIIVKAPRYATKKDIETVLLQHLGWIEKGLTRAREKQKWTQSHQFRPGEKFLYLGKLYPLQITQTQQTALIFENEKFYLNKKYQTQAREVFINWYKRQALENFRTRARIFAPLLAVEYRRIKLSSARTRWGSCSSQGNINIVWRLIMAPQWVIDYVIVHELSHLRYMNHSRAFWITVAQIYPQYQQAKQWLKKYGHFLNI